MTFLNITCLIDNAAQPHSAFWRKDAYSHPEHWQMVCSPGTPAGDCPSLPTLTFSDRLRRARMARVLKGR
jgi:hypothetical protein